MPRVVGATTKPLRSSFLSCEKDLETIFRKLFVEDRRSGDYLKRLLIINTPDCLDTKQLQYQEEIDKYSIKDMRDKQYIRDVPRLDLKEHNPVQSYILIQFDNFLPTNNPEYRDCIVRVTCMSLFDKWQMDDFQLRPYKIAGYVDGLLNNARLSGIGTLQFAGAQELSFNNEFGGLTLNYMATHGSDDTGELK